MRNNLRASANFGVLMALSSTLSGCLSRENPVLPPDPLANKVVDDVPFRQESFLMNGKVDVLMAVDMQNIGTAEQREIDDAVRLIASSLDRSGLDYRLGMVNPSYLSVPAPQLAAANGILPIATQIAQMSVAGQGQNQILQAIIPILAVTLQSGAIGGTQNQWITQLLPVIDAAISGANQGQGFDVVLGRILPLVLASVAGGNNGQAAQAAAALLPVIMSLAQNRGSGQNVGQIIATLLPVIMSFQRDGGNSSQNQIISMIAPLIATFLAAGSNNGNSQALLSSLLPIVLTAVGSTGGSAQYVQLVGAFLPLILGLVQRPEVRQNPQTVAAVATNAGLQSVLNAVIPTQGASFARPDAMLNVIMVSERQAGLGALNPADTAQGYLRSLATAKGGRSEMITFDTIFSGVGNRCPAAGGLPFAAGLVQQLTQLRGGVVADLCSSSRAVDDSLAKALVSRLTSARLGEPAIAETVQVFLGGQSIPFGEANGWSLGSDGQTVLINGTFVPSGETDLVLRYQPRR